MTLREAADADASARRARILRGVRPRLLERFQLSLLLALLGVFLLWPIWLVVRGGFTSTTGDFSLWAIGQVFADEILRRGLLNSLLIAACTTTLATLISLPLGVIVSRTKFRGRGLLSGLLLLPLILPPFVGAIGMRHILGREGSLNALLESLGLIDEGVDILGRGGLAAIVLLEAISLYPIIFLNVTAALSNIDPALEEAARNVGAGAWTRFRRVTLPLVRPGIFAGATIVFIWSFTELGTPLMFEYYTVTPVQVFNGLKDMETSRQPYALVTVMLGVAIVFYLIGKLLLGGGAHAMQAKASVRREERALTGWRAMAAFGACASVVCVASLPHIGVILASLSAPGQWYGSIVPRAFTLEHYEHALTHPLASGSIRNSLLLSLAAAGAATVAGLMVARLVVRGSIRGRGVLDALSMLPLAVPGLVMAFGFVALSLEWPFKNGPLEPFASIIAPDPNPFPFLIIAYAVRRLPYVVRSAVAGLQQTSVTLEEAAKSVGAGRFTTLRRVVVPLIAANLAAGAILAFSFSMLEVSDSLILAQRERDYPITKAIWSLYDRLGDGDGIASAMGVWAMALLATTLLGTSALIGKKMGALFRA
ncbi:MAG: iron ABC transporter permease [Phycisphaerae bacterium]|nr:iron ABC transporter permease [Phycisphaerae bacterium]